MDTEVYTYDQGTGILDKASIKDYTMKVLSELDSVKNMTWLAIMDIDEENGVTMSIGTVSCPLNGKDYDTLFGKADKALYIAKGKGKTGISFIAKRCMAR